MVFSRTLQKVGIALFLLAFTTSTGAGEMALSLPDIKLVKAGAFIWGSDAAEREMAYRLDEKAYGHSITRDNEWYAGEFKRAVITLPDFFVKITLVTNAEYALFIQETGRPAPNVDKKTWNGYGLIHPFARTRKFAWIRNTYSEGRSKHPAVLISWEDATAYAKWLTEKTGKHWQLPTEAQWEKAARGTDGRYFPWGNDYDPEKLNSHDLGPFDTMPVGQFPKGASPFGLLDAAGQVFEWTRDKNSNGRVIVKGGSWDDKGCGVCRPAARHSRPSHLKHILIGFRLVAED